MKKGKVFYGWYIVIACLFVTAANFGFHNTASVFVRPITEDLGFSRGEFTFFRTFTALFSAFTLPYVGKLSTKYSIKKIMLIGTIINALTLGALAFANNIWQFYAIGFASGIVMNAGHFVMIAILLNRWFKDKSGLALGLAFTGSGIGSAVMNPSANYVIENFGWRYAFIFSAIIALVILLPSILLVIKDSPEEMGISPYVSRAKKESTDSDIVKREVEVTLKEARKTPAFWLLVFALAGFTFGVSGQNVHSVSFMVDIGFTQTTASGMITVTMISLTIGKIGMGYVFDRFGTAVGGSILCFFSILSPITALLAQSWDGSLWLHGIVLGMAATGFSIPSNIYITKFYGQKNFPMILGWVSVITTLAIAVSPPIMGFVHDILGTYLPAWYVLIALAVVVSACLFLADFINGKRSAV